MFNEMICFRCKDIVVVSVSAVTLPFFCDDCAENHGLVPSEATPEITPEITPEPPRLSEILETEKGQGTWTAADGSQQIQFTTPLPSDESTATIENTTLLIADLEQQVSDSKTALDESNELIGDLTQQLAKAKENLGFYDEAGRTVTGLLLAANKERNELSFRVFQLTGFNKYLGTALREQRERTKKYYERSQDSWRKAFFYENLGFWGRLFNHRYSGKRWPQGGAVDSRAR